MMGKDKRCLSLAIGEGLPLAKMLWGLVSYWTENRGNLSVATITRRLVINEELRITSTEGEIVWEGF